MQFEVKATSGAARRGRMLLSAGEINTPQLVRGFGRAKNVILLFLYGGVSQLDTLDPKPGAPEDIRGPFSPISTSLSGVQISEHLPKLAKMMETRQKASPLKAPRIFVVMM